MSPFATPQPGNRVSCLCLRCVRACVRDATRDQGVSRRVFVPPSPSPSPAPPGPSFRKEAIISRAFEI